MELSTIRPLSNKSKKRATRVLVKEDYDTTLPSTQESRRIVDEMRREITIKENEMNQLRETLARNDETDIHAAQAELNRLQTAFEYVVHQCEEKIAPVKKEQSVEGANLEGKRQYVSSILNSSSERKDFINEMAHNCMICVEELEDPEVPIYDNRFIFQIAHDSASIQSDIESLKRSSVLEKFTEVELGKMNDFLKRQSQAATEAEQLSLMNFNSAKQDIEVRFSQPKAQIIDENWLNSKKDLDYNELLLREANVALQFLNQEANSIETRNRESVENLRKLREEHIILNRYIPGENGTNGKNSRSELTLEQIENDLSKTRIFVLQKKLDIEKERLKPLMKEQEKIPNLLEKAKRKLIETNDLMISIDQDLSLTQSTLAQLLSEKQFGENQRDLLRKRLDIQKAHLRDIQSISEESKRLLQKQEKIMKLNSEMKTLKTMDFDRFTSTVSNLISIQGQLERE